MRDRDAAGRARNARPRDAYGRPLPRGTAGDEPTMPDDLAVQPAEGLAQAQRLLDSDRPFHAHEVLEAVWKSCQEAERELWRGLAQLAVGLTHARRGNARGARALLERAADRITPYSAAEIGAAPKTPLSPGAPHPHEHDIGTAEPASPEVTVPAGRRTGPYGIDVAGLARHARELAARIADQGLDAVTDADLRPRLTT